MTHQATVTSTLNTLAQAAGKRRLHHCGARELAMLPWLHLQQRQPVPSRETPSWWSASKHPADTLWRTNKHKSFMSRFSPPTWHAKHSFNRQDWESRNDFNRPIGASLCMMSCNIPNQSASRVAYQTEEHQKTNEDIKQQQAEVTQPPVYIQMYHNVSYKQIHRIRSATNYLQIALNIPQIYTM